MLVKTMTMLASMKLWLNTIFLFRKSELILILTVLTFLAPTTHTNAKSHVQLESFEDLKVLKKFLRTKTNVLMLFSKDESSVKPVSTLLNEVAISTKGFAKLAKVNCDKAKKLCKKLKANPKPLEWKHFKDGEYHKDYDRLMTAKSMVNFLKDPTGDLPWDEESTATDVHHLQNSNELERLMKKSLKMPALVMFYAPWCGFCKRLKPDFAAAATALKGESLLAGMDVDQTHNQPVRTAFNITAFPTIMYFEKGVLKYKYGGENNKDGIINWMRNPSPPKEEGESTEASWADEPSEVQHLSELSFDPFLASHNSTLVMFYAPWCGHCKKMKPGYTEAAGKLKEEGIDGVLAAVDATKERRLGERFEVKGYPTLKYFKDGEFAFDLPEREGDKILLFMKDPKEPPPPPPPEKDWADEETDVVHLSEDDFASFLKKKKHTLVIFYAPWCGHCKRAKPHFTEAAAKMRENSKVSFAAVDCTKHNPVCQAHEVQGFPTFKYFNYGKNPTPYEGGREEKDFIAFMEDPSNPRPSKPDGPSPQEQWAEHAGSQSILHVDSVAAMEGALGALPSMLVMFYAPWCGHCNAMKPAYAKAAERVATEGIGKLVAVDATQATDLASKYGIRGYPTLKYFKEGQESFEYKFGRDEESLVDFMRSPRAPPPPPEPEPEWHTLTKDVMFLDDDSFDGFIEKTEDVLVLFYAPWCGYCKKIKPAYFEAAKILKEQRPEAKLVAIDATKARGLSKRFSISGYPTIKRLVNAGAKLLDFNAARTTDGIVKFMSSVPTKDEL